MRAMWTTRLRKSSPLRIVEYVISVTTILGGLFILSPFLILPVAPKLASPLVGVILSTPGIVAVGVVAIVSGILWLIGLMSGRFSFHSIGIFTNALVRLYAIIAGWLISGEVVYPWSSEVVLLAIVVIIYFYYRLFVRRERYASD